MNDDDNDNVTDIDVTCLQCCQVLESVVKNCGSIVHVDIATRDFMDFMKDQAKVT